MVLNGFYSFLYVYRSDDVFTETKVKIYQNSN